MKTKPNQTSPRCPCSQHPAPYFRHPANSSQSNALALWLYFSSRFQRSPGTDLTSPLLPPLVQAVRFTGKISSHSGDYISPTPPNLSFPIQCWSLVLTKVAQSTSPALGISVLPVLWNISQTLELICSGTRDIRLISHSLTKQLPVEGPSHCWVPRAVVHTSLGQETKKGTISDCSHGGTEEGRM